MTAQHEDNCHQNHAGSERSCDTKIMNVSIKPRFLTSHHLVAQNAKFIHGAFLLKSDFTSEIKIGTIHL